MLVTGSIAPAVACAMHPPTIDVAQAADAMLDCHDNHHDVAPAATKTASHTTDCCAAGCDCGVVPPGIVVDAPTAVSPHSVTDTGLAVSYPSVYLLLTTPPPIR